MDEKLPPELLKWIKNRRRASARIVREWSAPDGFTRQATAEYSAASDRAARLETLINDYCRDHSIDMSRVRVHYPTYRELVH